MQNVRKRYIGVLAVALVGIALYYGIRTLRISCIDGFASTDSPTTTRVEAELFLKEAESLYDRQRNEAIQNQPLPKPLKVDVSGRAASLWVSGPLYAGDFRYAQLWQQIYGHYHNGLPCVRLRLLWKNGGIVQQFPPDTL